MCVKVHSTYTEIFKSVLNKHAPPKTKLIGGSLGLFMPKQYSKTAMKKYRLRNSFLKRLSRQSSRTMKEWKVFQNI